MIEFGTVWHIETKEDYDKAMDYFESMDFIAQMSDDYSREQAERAEIARQAFEVIKQAREKGLID